MKKKSYSVYIIGGVVVVIGIWLITTFNALVKKEEKVKLQWNEVQNAYQRRMDLVPNLVNVVKGGADFEQNTLVQVTQARSKAASVNVSANDIDAAKFNEQSAAQDELAAAANRLLVTVEKYPDLQGIKAFSGLQTQLERTELRIKVARKDFNGAIAEYNKSVKTFPTKLAASIFGFSPREGFQSDAGADRSVEIKF
jgi:LemA protein